MANELDWNVDFPTSISREVAGMFIGRLIDSGMSRAVYSYVGDPTLVVKVENAYGQFQNVYEHQVWAHVNGTKFEKWFAPVERISSSGSVLLMRRTHPITESQLPKTLPSFFTDIKIENWGLLDGRIVCHDYGHHRLLEVGMTNRLRKAQWSLDK